MAIADLVYPSDLNGYYCCPPTKKASTSTDSTASSTTTNCNCQPPEYPYPYPPFGYPYPPVPPQSEIKIKKNSVESQICKLSKKSAVIKKMIEDFEDKNKDAILKIGASTYNFGSFSVITVEDDGSKSEDESVYGETILTDLLKKELEAIKTKLVELTSELEDEVGESTTVETTEKTITQS
jgi:hypothetical protein